ncbi:MAG TPA: hypothetical protein VFF06_06500 [Polyangia bacterium]|nr:hypothetical protein [Polyangia bacterium]
MRWTCLVWLSMASVAAAQEIPDAAWSAMVMREVTARLADGREVSGDLSGFDARHVTILVAERDSTRVVELERAQVVSLRVVAAAEPLPKARHVGVHAALGPVVLALDFDYHPFYGFVSGSVGMPAFTGGETGAFAVGLGHSFRIKRTSPWKFDLFAVATAAWSSSSDGFRAAQAAPYGGLGVGLGFHYTYRSGFAVGFKLPVIGVAFGGAASTESAPGQFYVAMLQALPIVSLGWRF